MSFKDNRITDFTMPLTDVIVAMVDGNPGALEACLALIGEDANLDDKAKGLIDILKMDDQHIYGPNIWLLYKDVSGKDVEVFRKNIDSYKAMDMIKDDPSFVKNF